MLIVAFQVVENYGEGKDGVLHCCKFKTLSLDHNLEFGMEQFSREDQENLGISLYNL